MPEDINRTNWADTDKLVSWFIIEALAHDTSDEVAGQIANGGQKTGPHQVHDSIKLTINGIEVPLMKSFERYSKHCNEAIAEKALELLREKYDFKIAELAKLFDSAREEIRKKFESAFGIEIKPEEERY